MSILDYIVQRIREGVEERSENHPVEKMRITSLPRRSLTDAIRHATRAPLISEIKRASPSSGGIRPDLDVAEVARAMTSGGAIGISVLTQPRYFLGRLHFLHVVRKASTLPILRKDFIIDEYQLYESAEAGADVVLLIVSLLSKSLPSFVEIAHRLGMETLVEVSNEAELGLAISAEPDLIGINNRDLRNMKVDLSRTERLAKEVPADVLTVSESGIKEAWQVQAMLRAGADAVLVGTSIMSSSDIERKIRELTVLEM